MLILPSPAGTEKRPLLRASKEITITRVSAVITAGTMPTVTFTVRHGPDISAAGTLVKSPNFVCNMNGAAQEWTSFNSSVVSAGDWIWVLLSACTGTPTAFTLQIDFA